MGKLNAFFEKAKKKSGKVPSNLSASEVLTDKRNKELDVPVLEEETLPADLKGESDEWSTTGIGNETESAITQPIHSPIKIDVVDSSALIKKEAKVIEWKNLKNEGDSVSDGTTQGAGPQETPEAPKQPLKYKPRVLSSGRRLFSSKATVDPDLQESVALHYVSTSVSNVPKKKKAGDTSASVTSTVLNDSEKLSNENQTQKEDPSDKSVADALQFLTFDILQYVNLKSLKFDHIEPDNDEIQKKYLLRRKGSLRGLSSEGVSLQAV